jgi:sialic acid synthase SpsE
LPRLHRGLTVRHDMKAGAKVTAEDITWLRPQTAFPLGTADRVVGHTLKRDLPAGYQVNPEDID